MHFHIYIHGFGCRADRQRMGVPYSLEDSSGWSVCCLPAAHTPVIHLPLPGPLRSSHYTHRHARTHTHVHKLTTVSVCIVLLCGHKSLGVEGAGERGHQRVDQWGEMLRFSVKSREFLGLCLLLQRALAHVHAYQVTPEKVTTRQRS